MEDRLSNDFIIEQMLRKTAKNRRIVLCKEVTRESAFEVSYWLNAIQALDEKRGTKEPITVVVDSYGGSVYSGLALIGQIESMKQKGYKIITEGYGVAMSMGFLLAICGSERVSNKYTRYMFHQPSSGAWGTLEELKDNYEEVEKLWVMIKDITKKYTNMTDHELEEIRKKKTDSYFSPEEMLAMGAIDVIL